VAVLRVRAGCARLLTPTGSLLYASYTSLAAVTSLWAAPLPPLELSLLRCFVLRIVGLLALEAKPAVHTAGSSSDWLGAALLLPPPALPAHGGPMMAAKTIENTKLAFCLRFARCASLEREDFDVPGGVGGEQRVAGALPAHGGHERLLARGRRRRRTLRLRPMSDFAATGLNSKATWFGIY
jgi:hypothetical protein